MSVFVKAVEMGSFSATADAMEMSPQLVGKHVQALEEHLGVKLISRTTRRQYLTAHECLGFSLIALRKKWTLNGLSGPITVPISGRLMVDSGQALLAAARAGLGLLLQPMELVQPELDAGRLIPLLPDHVPPTRPLHLVYTPDRRMTPKLRSFVDFALDAFGG